MLSKLQWTPISAERNEVLRVCEPVQPYFFFELVRWYGAGIFLDVGANIGSYSLGMTGIDSVVEVHAFEPSPETYAELVKNIKLNGLEGRVHAHQLAVSAAPGRMPFAVLNNYSGANGLVETHIHSDQLRARTIEVPVDALDNIQIGGTAGASAMIAIKVDVEGHEKLVLAGAGVLIGSHDIVLQVESYEAAGRGSAAEVPGLLRSQGFEEIWRIGPDRYYARCHRIPTPAEILDIVAAAHIRMIEDFRAFPYRSGAGNLDSAITRRIFGDLFVSIGGRSANQLRLLRDRIKKIRSSRKD